MAIKKEKFQLLFESKVINENAEKLTFDLKDVEDMKFGGVDERDRPDFVDAYLESASVNGRDLTEDEIDCINDYHSDFVSESIFDQMSS